jgi:hypothetical protein
VTLGRISHIQIFITEIQSHSTVPPCFPGKAEAVASCLDSEC